MRGEDVIANVSISHPHPAARLCTVVGCSLWLVAIAAAAESSRTYLMNAEGERPQPVVAVDNVCAWPNLTLLPSQRR